jgi:hypothetical protein
LETEISAQLKTGIQTFLLKKLCPSLLSDERKSEEK